MSDDIEVTQEMIEAGRVELEAVILLGPYKSKEEGLSDIYRAMHAARPRLPCVGEDPETAKLREWLYGDQWPEDFIQRFTNGR